MTTKEPRRHHYLHPSTGNDTQHALDNAINTLTTTREMWPPDPATTLHILTSLQAELEQRIPAVAHARHHDHSWAEIADLLGVTRASAWQRYAHHPESGAKQTSTVGPILVDIPN